MLRPAGIHPSERPCGSTIYLSIPKPAFRIKHNFAKPFRRNPTLSTIDGRLIYSFCENGVEAIDVFSDSIVFIPYHFNSIYVPEMVQITNDTFIYRINSKVIKIQMNIKERCMQTLDENQFERSFGCSERIVGERYIIYQWSLSHDFVNLHLFHIDDIHTPLQTFRLSLKSRFEHNCFGLFHIFDDKLYFFTKFTGDLQTNTRIALDLGSLHVYCLKSGYEQIQSTSNMPSFYYSPPSDASKVQTLFIQNSYWNGSRLFLRIKEIENQISFHHIVLLDLNTLQWCLVADVNIEMKLSVLFDKNGFMTLVNMRSDRKEQTVYRIALSEPESLKHLSLFAVKRLYPNMFKMTVEERLAHRLPPCLPIHPLFDHMESDNSQFHSVKSRFSNFMKKVFSLQ